MVGWLVCCDLLVAVVWLLLALAGGLFGGRASATQRQASTNDVTLNGLSDSECEKATCSR